MNIYLLERTDSISWDDYIGAVVCAKDENTARMIHPNGYSPMFDSDQQKGFEDEWASLSWVEPSKVKVTYLGKADESIKENSVIMDSFNAG